MRLLDRLAFLGVADRPHDGDRLRRRRGLIDPGDAVLAGEVEQALAGDGVAAIEEAKQVLRGHLAVNAEACGEAAERAWGSGVGRAVLGDVGVAQVVVDVEEVVGDGAEVALRLA